jgi:outer membrane protein OmpA-like peptidoglycan-associated protein
MPRPEPIDQRHPCLLSVGTRLAVSLTLMLAGCQNLSTPNSGNDSVEPTAARAKPYYVRVQPEATSLIAANDDGENTFLEFGILPPGELKLFDSDGKPLRAVWVRNMAIIAGTHQGILLRLGTATSYLSLHPQADRLRKPPLVENALIHELRDRLLQDGQRGAMARALVKANSLEQTSTVAVQPAPSNGALTNDALASVTTISLKPEASRSQSEPQLAENRLAREAMERTVERLHGNLAPVGTVLAKPVGNPNGAASPLVNGAEQPEIAWPRTQRVFFATNSIGISAPDDGLQRLLIDARQSDEIWIAGHTDSTGARDVNALLAKRRAAAVKYILTSRGVPAERIVIVRAPSDTYIAGNETEVGRSQNRRVEVTFIRSRSLAAARAGVNN